MGFIGTVRDPPAYLVHTIKVVLAAVVLEAGPQIFSALIFAERIAFFTGAAGEKKDTVCQYKKIKQRRKKVHTGFKTEVAMDP